jgi:hypothetical protein
MSAISFGGSVGSLDLLSYRSRSASETWLVV